MLFALALATIAPAVLAQDADEAGSGGNQVLQGGVSYDETAPSMQGDTFSAGSGDPLQGGTDMTGGGDSTGGNIFGGGLDSFGSGDPSGGDVFGGGTDFTYPSAPGGTPPSSGPTQSGGLADTIIPPGNLPCGMNTIEARAWDPGMLGALAGIIPNCREIFGSGRRLRGYVSNDPPSDPSGCVPLTPPDRGRLMAMARALDQMVGGAASSLQGAADRAGEQSSFIRGFVDPIKGALRFYAQRPGVPVSQTINAVTAFLASDDETQFQVLYQAATNAIATAQRDPAYAAGFATSTVLTTVGPVKAASCSLTLARGAASRAAGLGRAVTAARRLYGVLRRPGPYVQGGARRIPVQYGTAGIPGPEPPKMNGRIISPFFENQRCVPSAIAQVKYWKDGIRRYADDIQPRWTDGPTSEGEVELLLRKNFGQQTFDGHYATRRLAQAFGKPVAATQGMIEQELLAGGSGSSGIVFMRGIRNIDGTIVNHAFVAKNVVGRIRFYDPMLEYTPSGLPTDASTYFQGQFSDLFFYRTN